MKSKSFQIKGFGPKKWLSHYYLLDVCESFMYYLISYNFSKMINPRFTDVLVQFFSAGQKKIQRKGKLT